MLRRVVALLLIASSGWLLYQAANDYLGGIDFILSERLVQQLGQPRFLLPAIGGTLGLVGGLIVFFGGPGGAAIAMIGGVAVAGFAVSLKQSFDITRFWENELAVGVTILVLAGLTAVMGRN
jgi:hypothetical protein